MFSKAREGWGNEGLKEIEIVVPPPPPQWTAAMLSIVEYPSPPKKIQVFCNSAFDRLR